MAAFGSPFGFQMLIDQNQQMNTDGVPVFYVVENYDPQVFSDIAQIGLQYSDPVSGQSTAPTETAINPPPQPSELSLSQVKQIASDDLDLRVGSIMFTVSNTWVEQTRVARNFQSGSQVFTDDSVRGLKYHNILYSIVSAVPNKGITSNLSWNVYCNAPMHQGETR